MRLFFTALASLFLIQAANAQVSGVKFVYIMPMTGGLDQYLALQLSSAGTVQIVTDPQKADAVLTDHIGARFEQRWDEISAPKDEKTSDKVGDKAGEKTKPDADANFARVGMSGTTAKGAFFLVERSTRSVIWSTFALSNSNTPKELNHTAEIIAERLGKTAKGK